MASTAGTTRRNPARATSAARQQATTALLDAAESLLVDVGQAGVTVRVVAERASVNPGLVHYYFGSMEELLMQTLERFTSQLLARQKALYDGPEPFADKWRNAMHYLTADFDSGYQKVWFELQAMAWNHPEMRARVATVRTEWIDVLKPAFEKGLAELGVDTAMVPADVVVALVATFNQGIMLERLSGSDSGHQVLLSWIDAWLTEQERRGQSDARA
ncbi:TetR/AcrR family transcriptional regulator [Glaciibacter superstes]|uniref:TetR/AcrR family transcriptional regulator n=1 Tax=Glaciibacter superstes TaxID=501023 RepID=UPI000422526C|nr:TetR/AcrR family transcriptional regulator [Glaciibacter superstes]